MVKQPKQLVLPLGIVLAFAACADGADDSVTGSIAGSITVRHITPGGVSEVPEDLSDDVVEAYIPDGQGGVTTTMGIGDVDGTFEVPAFADGDYVLRLGRLVRRLDTPSSDYEYEVLGREDAATATQPTPVDLSLTGLWPWASGDDLQLFSPGAGLIRFGVASANEGDTTIASSIDWSNNWSGPNGFPLVDAGAGDTLTVLQVRQNGTNPNGQVHIAHAQLTMDDLTLEDGVPGTIDGALSMIPLSESAWIDWRRSAFNDSPSRFGAGATLYSDVLAIDTLPMSDTYGQYAGSPDLVVLTPDGLADTEDWIDSVSYGNPFPASWGQFALVRSRFVVPLLGGQDFMVSSGTVIALDAMEASGIGPVVGPVRNVQVDGRVITDGMTDVGLTPTVTWDPPELGTPTTYVVRTGTILDDNSLSYQASGVLTSQPSLQLAPGALQAGSHAFLYITAYVEGSPYPSGYAGMVTGVFDP